MALAKLPSKPQAPLAYNFLRSSQGGNTPLVVFINGLGLPAASWTEAISLLRLKPHCLTYDRYGQGATTSHDPTDEQPGKEPGYGHDLNDAVNDLHELLHVTRPDGAPLIFVAASIGVHIARLYAQKYPSIVKSFLFLDSNIGNAEFTDFWPNPHAAGFKPHEVIGDDCTLEQYIDAFASLDKMFNSNVKNPEGLDRRNIKRLLPDPSAPKLKGPDGYSPRLIVVGHDPEVFIESNFEKLKIPTSITRKYTQP